MQNKVFLTAFVLFLCFFPSEGVCKKKSPFPSGLHVVLFGFDGWGSYSMPKAEMPVVKQLMREGCWTLKKRAVLPSSSAANWASVFMGASPEIHGYTQWNSKTPEIPSRIVSDNSIFPTISQLLRFHNQDAEIGLLYQWDGIKYVADTLSINYVANLPKPDKNGSFSGITKIVGDYIVNSKPILCTIIYDYPDHYGHSSGFNSDEYYKSLREVDKSLGEIVQRVKDAGFYDKTIFLVTSDHGGIGKDHGGKTLAEMETPFVICGPNIKKSYEIEDSMMQFDVAATIAYILGLETPQVWIGRPILSIFEKRR